MNKLQNCSRNLSFDFFRLIFCFTIFFNHCSFFKSTEFGSWFFESFLHNGRYGVTFFFMLSAFCLFKSSYTKFHKQIIFSDFFAFIKKRLIKIYPLYFFTNLFVAIGQLNFLDLLFSVSMTQVFFIEKWGILNSAGWFVCALFFLYVISPFLVRLVGIISERYIVLSIVLCVCLICFQDYCIYKGAEFEFYSENQRKLYAYIYPFYWISIFLLGMMLGRLSSFNNFLIFKSKQYSSFEIFSLVFCFVIYMVCLNSSGFFYKYQQVFYAISCGLLILTFDQGKGIISKKIRLLKCSRWGEQYSFEIYLIHFVVIRLFVSKSFDNISSYFNYSFWGNCLLSIILFIITMLIVICYKSMVKNLHFYL